jgi:hypothetical protein
MQMPMGALSTAARKSFPFVSSIVKRAADMEASSQNKLLF